MNERRIQILQLHADGYVSKEICEISRISAALLFKENIKIRQNLGAKTIHQAVAMGIFRKLIQAG